MYGKVLTVNFISFIREIEKFSSAEELSAQVKADIQSTSETAEEVTEVAVEEVVATEEANQETAVEEVVEETVEEVVATEETAVCDDCDNVQDEEKTEGGETAND